jgi:hypothetical protein
MTKTELVDTAKRPQRKRGGARRVVQTAQRLANAQTAAEAPGQIAVPVGENVRTRERSAVRTDGERNVQGLLRQLLDAVTVSTQLDALVALGFVDYDLEKLTKRSRTTVYMWRRGKTLPPAELAEIIDDARYAAASLLGEHVPFDDASLLAWLRARSSDLGGRRPLEALAEKEFEAVVTAGRRWVGAEPPALAADQGDAAGQRRSPAVVAK